MPYGLIYHKLRGQTKRLGRKETKKGKQIKAVVRRRVIARIVAGTDGHEHARIKAAVEEANKIKEGATNVTA